MISKSFDKRMRKLYDNALRVSLEDVGRIVIMSDCHRADGRDNDNFAANEKITFRALKYYYEMGYTYIELGDGDELWENKKYDEIINVYNNIFWMLSLFYQRGRLYMLYGNHDIVKRRKRFCDKYLQSYYCENERKDLPLMENIRVHEALVISLNSRRWNHNTSNITELLLVHGHQGDFINDRIWKVTRWLVRYVWRPLELVGFSNPGTRPVNNYKNRGKKGKVEEWSEYSRVPVIAGHTHLPSLPDNGGTYYNCGCLVHPRCITAIELERNTVRLVKWCTEVEWNGVLTIKRSVIDEKPIIF